MYLPLGWLNPKKFNGREGEGHVAQFPFPDAGDPRIRLELQKEQKMNLCFRFDATCFVAISLNFNYAVLCCEIWNQQIFRNCS